MSHSNQTRFCEDLEQCARVPVLVPASSTHVSKILVLNKINERTSRAAILPDSLVLSPVTSCFTFSTSGSAMARRFLLDTIGTIPLAWRTSVQTQFSSSVRKNKIVLAGPTQRSILEDKGCQRVVADTRIANSTPYISLPLWCPHDFSTKSGTGSFSI